VGVAAIKWFGTEGDYRILVLDLLGPSLHELFVDQDRIFSLKTVLMLADQLLTRFEYLHARSYTHGSVKPANFAMGLKQRVRNCCYMIDFGRSKKYISTKGVHIDVDSYASTMQGPFFSINACEGGAQSRRDDMQSLGYMLMYFLRGSLPWAPVNYNEKLRIEYLQMKKDTSAEQLCRGYPREFSEYFAHIASLGFEDRPDYAHLRGLFADDGMYDWSRPAPVGTTSTSTAAISSADTTTPTAAAVDGASTAAVPAADTTSNTATAVDGASTAAGLAADTTSNTAAAVDGASTAAVPAADTTTPTAAAVDGASTGAGLAADTTAPTAAAAIDGASTSAVPSAETTIPIAAAVDGASPCAVICAETTAPSAALTAGCTTATAAAAAAAAAVAVAAPLTSTVTNPVVEVTMAAAVVATAFSTVSDPVIDASGLS
jgi:hypothetical protein